MLRRPVSILLFLGILLVPVSLLAQTVTGTMQGTVTDASGGVLPGVTVTIRNAETGLQRVVTTNEAGFYSAPFLPIGRYNVTAELAGLGNTSRNGVRVELNTKVVQHFVLAPSMSETVTVSADAPHIDVTDGEIKSTLTAREIMDKPTLGQNNFLSLATLFPGFQENPNAGQDNPTLSSGSSVNFSGTGTRGTTFQINGVNNDDSSENQNRQGVPLATIKSFQVITNNFSAEFGRGYGAVVLVQTKSGTNDVDGELYDYSQRAGWNEKSYFSRSQPKPNNQRDEFGLTGGFPIVRDMLFGFFNYDRVRRGGQLAYNRSIITAADLALPRLTLGNDTPANRAFIDSVLNRFPQNVTPNNAALGPRVYSTNIGFSQPDLDASSRIDWNAGKQNAVTARYQKTHQVRTAEDVIIGEQTGQDNRQSNLGITWTNIIGSNTVQEARYGLGLRSTNANILAGNDTPIIRFSGITSGPIIGNAGAFPINRNQRDNQLVYNLSSVLWTKHTLRGGFDLRRSQLNDRADNNTRGFYSFGTSCGGVTYPTGIAAMLAGCVSSYTIAYGPRYLENELREGNFYAQDDYRIHDNLTLNIGARYEIVDAPKEAENRVDYGFGRTKYVDPRLGFAYSPGSNRPLVRFFTGGAGRSSIRGGYGIFHGRVFQSVFSQSGASIRYNPPNAASLGFTGSTNLADPTNGFVFQPGKPQTARVQLTLVDPDLKMPETRQWNLTFERQILNSSKVRFSYTGTQGRNLIQYGLDNLPLSPLYGPVAVPNHPFNGTLAGTTITQVAADWRCAGTGLPGAPTNATCPVPVPLAPNEISLRFPRTNERRPNPLYTTNLVVSNQAQSWYNAGQVELVTGYVHGFHAQMSYTLSKAIDTGSEATSTGAGDRNSFVGKRFARGLSRYDTRHRFTGLLSYELPFFRNSTGIAKSLLGGWQLASTLRLASGTPFTVIDSNQPDLDFDAYSEQRPILVDASLSGRHIHGPDTSQSILRRSAFRQAGINERDQIIGRNTFYSDSLKNVDAALYKTFAISRGNGIMLRVEAYNVFNKVQWGIPVNDLASADFGKVLSTSPNYIPRSYQLGIRYIY